MDKNPQHGSWHNGHVSLPSSEEEQHITSAFRELSVQTDRQTPSTEAKSFLQVMNNEKHRHLGATKWSGRSPVWVIKDGGWEV